jgi:hypothetical protein
VPDKKHTDKIIILQQVLVVFFFFGKWSWLGLPEFLLPEQLIMVSAVTSAGDILLR